MMLHAVVTVALLYTVAVLIVVVCVFSCLFVFCFAFFFRVLSYPNILHTRKKRRKKTRKREAQKTREIPRITAVTKKKQKTKKRRKKLPCRRPPTNPYNNTIKKFFLTHKTHTTLLYDYVSFYTFISIFTTTEDANYRGAN